MQENIQILCSINVRPSMDRYNWFWRWSYKKIIKYCFYRTRMVTSISVTSYVRVKIGPWVVRHISICENSWQPLEYPYHYTLQLSHKYHSKKCRSKTYNEHENAYLLFQRSTNGCCCCQWFRGLFLPFSDNHVWPVSHATYLINETIPATMKKWLLVPSINTDRLECF